MTHHEYDGGPTQLQEMRNLIIASEQGAGLPLGWQCALLENWRHADVDHTAEFFRRNAHLWRNPEGRLAGFAVSYRGGNRISLHALPAVAQALLPEMLEWAEAEWAAGQTELGVNCYRHNDVLHQLLVRRGFRFERAVTCTYVYDLTNGWPERHMPEGYRIASLSEHGDVDGLIELESVVFAAPDLDRRWYAAKSAAPGYAADLYLHVVAPSGRLVAFAQGWPDYPSARGEIDPVGTHPEARRLGLAAAVVTACFARMYDLGIRRAYIATEAEPYSANRLYESLRPTLKAYDDRWIKVLRHE